MVLMLALDDPRWKELDHRGWTEGKRDDLDSDAPLRTRGAIGSTR